MVKEEKLNKSILAVQDLVIRARNLAYQKKPHDLIAKLLDDFKFHANAKTLISTSNYFDIPQTDTTIRITDTNNLLLDDVL